MAAIKQSSKKRLPSATHLVLLAIGMQLLAVALAFYWGPTQAVACPRNETPVYVILVFITASIASAVAATFRPSKRARIVVVFALLWVVMVLSTTLHLLFVANGGLNWCNVQW